MLLKQLGVVTVVGLSIISFALFVGCGDANDEEEKEKEKEVKENQFDENVEEDAKEMGGQEAILETGVEADQVVAEVNGEKIYGDNYNSAYQRQVMMMQMQGISVEEEELKEEVLSGLIGNELLVQEAKAQGLTPDSESVEEEMEDLKAQFDDGSEYEQALKEEGITEEELKEMVQDQVVIEMFIEQKIEEAEIEVDVTEEDLKEVYEGKRKQLKEQMGIGALEEKVDIDDDKEEKISEEMPGFEEMRDQLEEEAKEQQIQQKERQVINDFVDELREEAEIEIHI